MIYYQREYKNEFDHTIIHNIVEYGTPPDDFVEFFAVGTIAINVGNQQNIEEKIFIPIDANNISDAFDKFESTMKEKGNIYAEKYMKYFEEKMKEIQHEKQNKIILPYQKV